MANKNISKLELACRYITACQVASDGGKHIYMLPRSHREMATALKGYALKVYLQEEAIKIIDSFNSNGDITYYVTKEEDQNGFMSILVYFEFKIGGVEGQISFHNPINQVSKYLYRKKGKGRKTTWDGNIGGSREAAEYLRSYFSIVK